MQQAHDLYLIDHEFLLLHVLLLQLFLINNLYGEGVLSVEALLFFPIFSNRCLILSYCLVYFGLSPLADDFEDMVLLEVF